MSVTHKYVVLISILVGQFAPILYVPVATNAMKTAGNPDVRNIKTDHGLVGRAWKTKKLAFA